MKKLIVGIICLISFLISSALIIVEKSTHARYLNNVEDIGFNMQKFYVQKTNVKHAQEISFFETLVDTYDASIIRTDRFYNEDRIVIYKSGIFSNTYINMLQSKLEICSGNTIISDDAFLATFETNDMNQSGRIKDFLNDTPLILQSLKRLYSENSLTPGGEYSLIVDHSDSEIIIDMLADFYSISKVELLTPTTGFENDIGGAFYLLLFFSIILLLVYILLILFYPLAKSREISCMKMLGYSNLLIWNQIFGKIFTYTCLFTVISMISQIIKTKNVPINFMLKLIIIHSIFLLVCLIISTLSLALINKIPISIILKKYTNLKMIVSLNYMIKFLIYIFLVFMIPIAIDSMKTFLNISEIRQVYVQQSNYVTLSKISYNEYEIGDTSIEQKLLHLFHELEKTVDAQYIVSERFYPNRMSKEFGYENNEYVNIIQVNKNFLDENHLPIDYVHSFSDDKLSVHLPDNINQEKAKNLVLFLIADYLHELISDEIHLNHLVEFKQYPENNVTFFSENIDMMDIEQGFIKNPIIICLSNPFLTLSNSRLQNSAIYNPLRIENNDENHLKISNAIRNNELDGNNLIFQNVLDTGYSEIFQMTLSEVSIWLAAILFSILVSVLASYYIVLTILISRQKQVSVLKLLGYSFHQIYKDELFYFGLIYLFGMIELLVLKRSLSSLVMYAVLTFIDFAIIFYLVIKYEKKNIVHILKGAD